MRCPLHKKRQQDVLMMVGKVRCEVAGPDALRKQRSRAQAAGASICGVDTGADHGRDRRGA
ncbi:putative usher domain protein [Burkholderia cepacia]|nr:putative usher domain protein [Burkholderia cepacia]